MKKTLITLAALAMASVASANATNGVVDTTLTESGSTVDLKDAFTMMVVLDWDSAFASTGGLGDWSADPKTSVSANANGNWWTNGLNNIIKGAGENEGKVFVSMGTDYAQPALTSNGLTLIENNTRAMIDDSYVMDGKVVLVYTFVADTDAATDGFQSAMTLYALKGDGSVDSASYSTTLEWALNDYAFSSVNITAGGDVVEKVLVYDGLLTESQMVYAYQTSIPEPTTATLSLLALAGLAARRRRK